MEQQTIETLKNRLSKLKHTKPNLYFIWNTYLDIKQKTLLDTMSQLNTLLDNIENNSITQDIPNELLLLTAVIQ